MTSPAPTPSPRRRMFWIIPVVLIVGWALLAIPSWRRPAVGLEAGHLRRCPNTPNCVCSEGATGDHAIEPIAFTGDSAAAWNRLQQVIEQSSGAAVIQRDDHYMHAEFTTRLMRYVDDVEFRLDAPSGQIHVRSASRVGRSDLGANRQRVEAIRRAFAQESGSI